MLVTNRCLLMKSLMRMANLTTLRLLEVVGLSSSRFERRRGERALMYLEDLEMPSIPSFLGFLPFFCLSLFCRSDSSIASNWVPCHQICHQRCSHPASVE